MVDWFLRDVIGMVDWFLRDVIGMVGWFFVAKSSMLSLGSGY